MIFAEFEVENNQFKFKGRDWAEASIAFVAAHDLFEHDINDSGKIEEEFMALGAGIYLRTGINPNPENNARLVGNDVNLIMSKYLTSEFKMPDTKLCGPLPWEIADLLECTKARVYSYTKDVATEHVLNWVHIGLYRAYLKFNKRIDAIREMYEHVFKVFRSFGYDSRITKGIISIVIDFEACQFDYQFRATE